MPPHTSPADRKLISVWLFVVCGLVVAMIVLGGATRLTDSGLSITEWQPVSGALPPLSDSAWREAFEKYKQIPEYRLVNPDMSLSGFKFIFWWEWSHRLLGRLIGVAFGLPLVVFVLMRRVGRDLITPLAGLFLLGGAQGVLGWYMVKSGLADRVDVSQYRLAAHLGLAFILLGALSFLAFRLGRPQTEDNEYRRRNGLWPFAAAGLLLLVFVQITLGALVAGMDAGLGYNTWPLMDGHFVPQTYGTMEPFYLNFFENPGAAQFNHRTMAYLVSLAVAVYAVNVWLRGGSRSLKRASLLLTMAVLAQVALGIWTLLSVVPLGLGLLHQGGAIAVYLTAIFTLHTSLLNE